MTSVLTPTTVAVPAKVILFGSVLLLATAAASLAGLFPIEYSIAIVFLFAGPHNWIEARYFLTRLPPRLGRLRRFFLVAIAGIVLLSLTHAALPISAHAFAWNRLTWELALAIWCTLLAAWIVWLVLLRSAQGPRRDWGLAVPLGLCVIGLCWLYPVLMLLSLVYLHPLVGFWILDREIKVNHRALLRTYRVSLLVVPLCIAGLAWQFAAADDLRSPNETSMWIIGQVGSNQLPRVSSHFLVATHAFLETLHYAVWLIAVPAASGKVFSASWSSMPITRQSGARRKLIAGILAAGGLVVVVLWAAFYLDYSTTRTVYFQVAMLHVLAEVPFLLRLL